MFKKVALVILPSLELERPQAAPAVLGGICRDMKVDYDIFDINLQLAKNLSQDDFNTASDHWRTVRNAELPNNVYYEFENTIDKILKDNFDMIAVSVFSRFSTRAAKLFCEMVKQKSKILLVAGGQGLTTPWADIRFGDWLRKQNLIDHVAWGDGDILWKHWLRGNFNVAGSDDLPPIQIQDIDNIPFADFTKINPHDYFYNETPGIYLTTSRGCVRKCTFCDVPSRWPKFKYRKGINVATEMFTHYRETGVQLFQFTDSVINGNLREFRSWNETIVKLKKENPDFKPRWLSQFNIRKAHEMPEDLYRLIAESGGKMLITGLEHASWAIRQHMGKQFDDADLDHHIKMCARYGIQNVFLMFIGYPTETLDDHQIQIDFLEKYQKYMFAGTIALIRWGYTGSIDHGSLLETKDLGFELVPEYDDLDLSHLEDQDADWVYGRNWINLKNPSLTLKERLRRRIELHEISAKLKYPITKGTEELRIIKTICEQLITRTKKTINREDILLADNH